ncbi:MAG: hypothetical protein F4093_06450 [Gammaproteobacteria bacterium]|nr:hypothetical protein [Gammaproteobacteria bacterium]MYJ52290.1 hypothetical protein [Gammaproteobacteria bacterium]
MKFLCRNRNPVRPPGMPAHPRRMDRLAKRFPAPCIIGPAANAATCVPRATRLYRPRPIETTGAGLHHAFMSDSAQRNRTMRSYLESIDLELDDSGRYAPRYRLFETTFWEPVPTTAVSYRAGSRLLVIADAEQAGEIESRLKGAVNCYMAMPAERSEAALAANAHYCAGLTVEGHLGEFKVLYDQHLDPEEPDARNLASLFGIESGCFDQVLDCSETPFLDSELKPPGYYCGHESADLDRALEAIPGMIGEFEKPKFFDYDPEICAHGRSGIRGCTNCLDACPADAIISVGERIEVNPHLCQGGGVCASSCPSGAITYVYPRAEQQLELLRTLVRGMLEAHDGIAPEVVFFDRERGFDAVAGRSGAMAHTVLPFMVEEIGSVGPDLLASALAYGAGKVFVFVPDGTPAKVVETLARTVDQVGIVLHETGCRDRELRMGSTLEGVGGESTVKTGPNATFAPVGDKRTVTRRAFGHLNEISETPRSAIGMPEGTMFGRIHVDAETCTLCMGCASQCPGKALQAGGDTPALRFIEANCVQCGICARSCPESSITLEPRLQFDPNVINKAVSLKEEVPFHCVVCGKAFATQAMISRMTEKLKGHWMFDKPDALNRLRMCEDCRVIDLFDKESRAGS